jgi:hypothetical protein
MKKTFQYSILTLGLLSNYVLAVEEWSNTEFPAASIRKVVIENDRGNLSLVSLSESETAARVSFRRGCLPEQYNVTLDQAGDTLRIIGKKPSDYSLAEFNDERLKADFRISVPKESEISVKLGIGAANISNLIGDMVFRLGKGSLDCGWSSLFLPPSIKIKLGSGIATLKVPEGARVRSLVKGMPFFYSYNSEVPEPSAGLPGITLKGGVGMGSIFVKKNISE